MVLCSLVGFDVEELNYIAILYHTAQCLGGKYKVTLDKASFSKPPCCFQRHSASSPLLLRAVKKYGNLVLITCL